MNKHLIMKFMLQLHKLPTCLELKCGKECWMMNSFAGDALEN